MSSPREQISPCRKRQRTEAGLSLDDPSELQPSKRLKSSTRLHSAAFYDSLSKVWLTRRSLKELDRRTSQANGPQRPASVCRQVAQENTWKKQIQRFARRGGPELRDLRGYPALTDVDLTRTMSSSSGSRQTQSTKPTSNSASSNRRSSAYDNDFEQHLVDHRVYPKGYDYPDGREAPEPGTLDELYQRLAQPRPSLSPSRFTTSDFRAFERKNDRVIDEGEVMRDVIPIICGNSDIPNKQNLLFTRLESITNGTTVNCQPDFYDGAPLEDIDKQVRDDLGPFIIPTRHRTAPVAPNFFLEAKAPKGGADVAKRQACYDGALGARAMHKLQSYKQDRPVYDGNAYTITSTYHAGNLNMYATHVTSSGPGGSHEYHMSQVGGWNIIGDPDTCRRGLTAVRNGRVWAQEQRNAFISAANERAGSVNAEPSLFESFYHNDGSDPTEVQDAAHSTQAGDPEGDPEDNPQYYMSPHASQGGYMNNEPSSFASDDEGLSDTTDVQRVEKSECSATYDGAGHRPTDWPTSESSDYNGPSETTDTYPTEESESSLDELALDIYSTSTVSKKRRNRLPEKTVSKLPRHSDGKSGERRRS